MQTISKPGLLLFALWLFFGCATVSDDRSHDWYQWTGHVNLKLQVNVTSIPPGAKVYVNQQLQGTTPCTVHLEKRSNVAGDERAHISGKDELQSAVQTRNTELTDKTVYTFVLVKEGFSPRKRTLVLEDYFQSKTLKHAYAYARQIDIEVNFKALY